MNSLVIACVLSIMTPQGQICVKPDGNVTYPQDVKIDDLSKRFYEQLGKTWQTVKTDWCI